MNHIERQLEIKRLDYLIAMTSQTAVRRQWGIKLLAWSVVPVTVAILYLGYNLHIDNRILSETEIQQLPVDLQQLIRATHTDDPVIQSDVDGARAVLLEQKYQIEQMVADWKRNSL